MVLIVEWNPALEFKQNHILRFVLISTVIKNLVFEISFAYSHF